MPTLPFALGDVLHQPVDGVVRVGRVVDGRRVQRPPERPVHDVVALRAVLAAHVLDGPDVAPLDDHVRRVVVALQDRAEVRALGVARELVGVVGRPREQDRRALRALRDQDHRVQLHPVPHGDHHVPPDVVEAVVRRLELRGDLARQVLVRRGRLGLVLCRGRPGQRGQRQDERARAGPGHEPISLRPHGRASPTSHGDTLPAGQPDHTPGHHGNLMPPARSTVRQAPPGYLSDSPAAATGRCRGISALKSPRLTHFSAPVQVHLGDGDGAPLLRLGDHARRRGRRRPRSSSCARRPRRCC